MEASDSGELLENVTMAEGTPFMIQRVEPQLLTSELLPTHSGIVVDMSNTEYLPSVTYTTEDLLSHDLTEEDRNLAAALVAVQLGQQQKHQQLTQDTNVIMNANTVTSLVSSTSLGIDSAKDVLSDQHQFVISTVNKPVLTSIDAAYIHAVDGRHLQQTTLPSLKKYDHISIHPHEQYVTQQVKEEFVSIKNEIHTEDSIHQRDSDCDRNDVRSSKKSLPHKKRISRKLKRPCNILKKGHKCTTCEQFFNTIDELANHGCPNVKISTINVFSCQICSAICKDQLSFFEHLKAHYEPAAENLIKVTNLPFKNDEVKDSLLTSLLPPLNCIHCGKNFRRQKAFEAHVREAHSNKVEDEFSEPEDLMEGIRSVVEAHDRDSDTELSDTKAWYDTNPLRTTDTDLNDIDLQEQVCQLCGQIFGTGEDVIQHLQECKMTVTAGIDQMSDNDKLQSKFKKRRRKGGHLCCPHCDRVFGHRNSLMYHMQSHTGERPHQCEVCGKSFFASSALKVHMRLHSGAKPYKCEYCGRHFRQWGDLKYHCISIHSDEKQYQCEYCGKDFARKYSLIVHRRIHTGEKNYRCEFCSKTFRASSYLQNHRRIHTGEKPHPCEVCGKPFRVRSDMKRHLNTHSRRRNGRPTPAAIIETSNSIIEVSETTDGTESIVPDNDVEQTEQTEVESVEQITDNSVEYARDPLESVREGTNTLFTNGHQLFICYPGELPVRSSLETQWIQADN